MSSIFPIQSQEETTVKDAEVVELGSERAEMVLDSLSSKTTRNLFLEVYNEKASISQLSDRTGDSIQNVKYHIEKLEESDLIKQCGTWYTENGNEMDIYGPANESVVLVASQQDRESAIKKALKKVSVVAVGATVASLLMNSLVSIESKIQSFDSEASINTNDASKIDTSPMRVERDPQVVQELTIGPFATSPEVGLIAVFLLGIAVGVLSYAVSDRLS